MHILTLQNKLPTLTPGPRYTHLSQNKIMKTFKSAQDIGNRARWVISALVSKSFTRLKISETCAEINPSRTRNNAICISSSKALSINLFEKIYIYA